MKLIPKSIYCEPSRVGGRTPSFTACRWTGRSAIARAHALARRIREVSIGLEEYSPYLDRDLADLNFFDAGDIPLPFGNPQRSLDMIEEYVDSILEKGKFPMGMGGEHLVSWPVIKAMHKKYPDLAIIHFDAHTDLRVDYEGEPLSLHADPQSGRIDRTEQCIFIRNPFRHERRV